MTVAQPPILIPAAVGSGPIVNSAYDRWSGVALSAFATAQQLAAQIANIPLSPIVFNASFDPQIALTPFPTLPKPTVPDGLVFNAPALPVAPPTFTVPTLPPLAYVSQLLAAVKTGLQQELAGNPMPTALATQLRNRAYSDANTEEQRAVDTAYSEFAARGFEEPGGQLNKRITEARNDARNKRQQLNRDIYIQDQQTVIDNLKFAIEQGIALEVLNVTVFRAQADVELESVRIAIQENQLELDTWRAQVEVYDLQLKAEITRMDELLKEFDASVRIYEADAKVATAAGEYDNRRFQLNLAQEQAEVDTEMKRADQGFEQMKYLTSVMLEIKKTIATVSAQLASSAMSAVNIGASLSSSTQESVGYDLRVDYSGQMT